MKSCALLLSLLLSLLLALAGHPAWADGELVTGPDRRHELDLRIDALEAERAAISTRGPKVATWTGLGVMVLGAVPLAVGLTAAGPYGEDYARWSGGVITGSVVIAIGGFTALTAGLIWNERVKKRNEIDAERELLIEKRAGLAQALSRLEVGSPVRNGTQFVTLGFRF